MNFASWADDIGVAVRADRTGSRREFIPRVATLAKAIPTHPDPPRPAKRRMTDRVLPDTGLEYFQFRDALASDIRAGLVGQNVDELMARARACSAMDSAQAAEWLERFLNDLKRGLDRKQGQR